MGVAKNKIYRVNGSDTSAKAEALKSNLGISPTISWSQSGRFQLNQEVTVTVTLQKNLGLLVDFAKFSIPL